MPPQPTPHRFRASWAGDRFCLYCGYGRLTWWHDKNLIG